MPDNTIKQDSFSAWNPGLESEIPKAYRELETIYQAENVSTRLEDVHELALRTGLNQEELVAFRPERLTVHELIVRVTADIVVLEGEEEEALGLNFRQIAHTILADYIAPHRDDIHTRFAELYEQVYSQVQQTLNNTLFAPPPPLTAARKSRFPFSWLWKSKQLKPQAPSISRETIQEKEYHQIAAYKEMGLAAEAPLEKAIYKSLYRVFGTIASTHGYVGTDQALLTELVTRHVCNSYGSRLIGQQIAPYIEAAIRQEGYTPIAHTKAPILISLKGASAAGKSSLRPMLKQVMGDLGIHAEDYATISPDIWRRFLLDYEDLGEAYKYAGRLSSNEVNIIDSKLDRYIRDKANRNRSIPNLLVDRFRFDSFSSEKISLILHDTYAKYVDTMYMYFVITPPEATVERGWERGQIRGRYKAVEDFLGHSVEAYAGMPKLLFKWLAYSRPLFSYVFLDNSVPKGNTPKTIAYGTQQEMNIFNPMAFIDIQRYQKINIKARSPQEVYPAAPLLSVANNCSFLKQCVQQLPRVNFIDEASGQVYMHAAAGQYLLVDGDLFSKQLEDEELAQVFSAIAPQMTQPFLQTNQ